MRLHFSSQFFQNCAIYSPSGVASELGSGVPTAFSSIPGAVVAEGIAVVFVTSSIASVAPGFAVNFSGTTKK